MAYRRSYRRGSSRSGRSYGRRVSGNGNSRRRATARSARSRTRRGYGAREVRIVVEQRAATPVMPVGVTDAGPPPRARF